MEEDSYCGGSPKHGLIVELVYADSENPIFDSTIRKGSFIFDGWPIMRPTANTIESVKKRKSGLATQTLNASQQQPCVPIQFIWCEGQLHPASDASKIVFTGGSCEQIGAVLYVRGEG